MLKKDSNLVFSFGELSKSIYDIEIDIIRTAIKKECKTLSVRRGRGTAYSWIEVSGSGKLGEFTPQEKQALERLGIPYGINLAVIGPESRRYYVERLARLCGIEIPEALKSEYEEMDKYKRLVEEKMKKFQNCNHDFKPVNNVRVFPKGTLYRCSKCGYEEIQL